MQKRLFTIWMGAMLAVAAFLAGCSDKPDDDRPEQEITAGNIYLRLRINIAGSGIPDGTRNTSRAGETTPGTDKENAIHRVDLLVYRVDDDGKATLSDVVPVNEAQISGITSKEGAIVSLYIQDEKKLHIYAAVNLTDKMREQFILKQAPDVSMSVTSDKYEKVINEFVPDSDGSQEKLGESGIPMTGQFRIIPENNGGGGTNDALYTIDVVDEKGLKETTPENPLTVTADIARIVAKIHVLAKTDEQHTDYVNAEASEYTPAGETDDPYANWIGWIRLTDVRYMPNGINKSTYFFPQQTDNEKWRDLNMNLGDYTFAGMELDRSNTPNWAKDFCFYNGLALHKENITENSHFAQAEAYKRSQYDNTVNGNNTDNRYTRGMYCPENYFDTPTDASLAAKLSNYEEAIPMVTHVSVAAKLTPKSIVLLANYKDKMDEFVKYYKEKKDDFYKAYDLTENDFTDKDVEEWQKMTKENDGTYSNQFTGDNNLYRNTYRIIQTESQADAAALLNWSMMANKLWSQNAEDFENGRYPAGTFYVYDTKYDKGPIAAQADANDIDWKQQYLYLSAGAVAKATGENANIKTYSVPHLGGWGYYYTYLDESNEYVPYTDSQVTRNTYYLITIGNFGTPGGTITRPEYIKVNTTPVGWDYTGKGEINLY